MAFVLVPVESFSAKKCQKSLVQLPQKLVKVVLHAQQLWSDIPTMKCTPANFIGHLWAQSSMKIHFVGPQNTYVRFEWGFLNKV